MTSVSAASERRAIGRPDPGRRPGIGAWVWLSPLLAWLLMFVVAPTAILLVYSVFQKGELGEARPAFTLQNYAQSLRGTYLLVFARSLVYAGMTTVACVLIGYPVAYAIARGPSRWRNRLLLLVMIPFLTSFLIRAYAWFIILRENGILNGAIQWLGLMVGLVPRRIELLYTPWAVLIALVYTYLPFTILPIYASVEKLDESLIEAAADLGASPARAFARVVFPLTWPGVSAGVVLVFVPSVAMFAVTGIMSGGKVRLIGDVIEDQILFSGNLPRGAAMAVLLLAIFLAGALIVPRIGSADREADGRAT